MNIIRKICLLIKVILSCAIINGCGYEKISAEQSADFHKKVQKLGLKLGEKGANKQNLNWKVFTPVWRISCGLVDASSYKKLSRNAFRFQIDVNDIGKCNTDRRPYKDDHLEFNWSERQEINSGPIWNGVYEFSATITIETDGLNAYRNTIFQIHDFRNAGAPPSYIQVYGGKSGLVNRFRLSHSECVSYKCKKGLPDVPKKSFRLKVIFEYARGFVSARYYIDDKFVISGGGKSQSPIFIKIGIYRILGKATTVQTYQDIKIRRLQ